MAGDVIRMLVVDDSALYRQLVRNVLRNVPGVEVVGVAASGQDALDQIDALRPDLLTLDVNMPGMNGIDVLRSLKQRGAPTRAIMLSGLTAEGAQVTTDALLEGAFDFILKPSGADAARNRAALLTALIEKVTTFRESRRADRGRAEPASVPARPAVSTRVADLPSARTAAPAAYDAIVIATSTGGPVALREILPQLPGDLPVPLLIVQHMPARYTHSLAQRLNEISPIEVVEACDGMTLEPGWAYIAPGGRQMKVERRAGRRVIRITDDPHENSCRPSADYLFRSVADVFAERTIAIVLTGMGKDGLAGCRLLKQRGAVIVAQHPDGCSVYGMPKAVAEDDLADRILPLDSIASWITHRMGREARN